MFLASKSERGCDMRTFWMATAVSLGFVSAIGAASASPLKDDGGHSRHRDKYGGFDGDRGRGHGWGYHHHGYGYGHPRGYGFYDERRSYRGRAPSITAIKRNEWRRRPQSVWGQGPSVRKFAIRGLWPLLL